MTRRFKILIVNNLNPGWPASDIDWSRRMVRQLSGAFKLNGWLGFVVFAGVVVDYALR